MGLRHFHRFTMCVKVVANVFAAKARPQKADAEPFASNQLPLRAADCSRRNQILALPGAGTPASERILGRLAWRWGNGRSGIR
jgi:hypothetical protein